MRTKILGQWGNSSIGIRLDAECSELGWKVKDKIDVSIVDGKVVLEKIVPSFKDNSGSKFIIKE